jgi:hypothetical protein
MDTIISQDTASNPDSGGIIYQVFNWMTQSTTGMLMVATAGAVLYATYYLFKPGRKIHVPVSSDDQSACYFVVSTFCELIFIFIASESNTSAACLEAG